MRKMYLLIGSVALGVGLVLGVVGYALATTPADGNSRLAFWDKKDSQSTTAPIGGSSGDSTTGPLIPGELNTGLLNPDSNTPGGLDPFSPEEEALDPSAVESGTTTTPNSTQSSVPENLAQEITADYKLNIATLFEAWKSADMVSFRAQLAKAYTGDLFEKHARQAEPFIAQGVGIEVSDIRFDDVKVDLATANSATLTASYNYVAQDYDIGNEAVMGESNKHQVKTRVNMVKKDARWLITGETILQP